METEIKTNAMPKGEEMTEKVVETTDELVENRVSAEESVEDTEKTTQSEQKPKVEPLPEQKPFLTNPYERAILEEMERRATSNQVLAEGLKNKDKSISECLAFVMNRAKKMATDNCAMVADAVVYDWAQFYYTQRREIIELEYEKPKERTTYTPPAPKPKTEKKETKKGETKKPEIKVVTKEESKTETAKVDDDEDMPTLF